MWVPQVPGSPRTGLRSRGGDPRFWDLGCETGSTLLRRHLGAPALVGCPEIEVDLAGRDLALVHDGVGVALVLCGDPEAQRVAFDLAFMHFGRRRACSLNCAGHR